MTDPLRSHYLTATREEAQTIWKDRLPSLHREWFRWSSVAPKISRGEEPLPILTAIRHERPWSAFPPVLDPLLSHLPSAPDDHFVLAKKKRRGEIRKILSRKITMTRSTVRLRTRGGSGTRCVEDLSRFQEGRKLTWRLAASSLPSNSAATSSSIGSRTTHAPYHISM